MLVIGLSIDTKTVSDNIYINTCSFRSLRVLMCGIMIHICPEKNYYHKYTYEIWIAFLFY